MPLVISIDIVRKECSLKIKRDGSFVIAGWLRSRRSFADRRRIRPLSETTSLARVPSGVSPMRLLRLQPAVHGRHATPLVQNTGVGESGCLSKKETRDSDHSGAILGLDANNTIPFYLHIIYMYTIHLEEFRRFKGLIECRVY